MLWWMLLVGCNAPLDGPPAPGILLDPKHLDFDTVVLGVDSESRSTIQIDNVGASSLDLQRIYLDEGEVFTIAQMPQDLSFTGFEGPVEVQIAFTPPEAGGWEDTLYVESNDPDEPTSRVYLAGFARDALDPKLWVSTTQHEFQPSWVGCDDEHTVLLRNLGEAELVLTPLSEACSSPEELALDTHGDLTLFSGEEVEWTWT